MGLRMRVANAAMRPQLLKQSELTGSIEVRASQLDLLSLLKTPIIATQRMANMTSSQSIHHWISMEAARQEFALECSAFGIAGAPVSYQ